MSKKAKELNLDVLDTHMGLFDYTVRVCIGEHEKALQYIAHIFEDSYEEMPDGNRGYEARGICYHKTGYVPIIWIAKYPETPREIATFAHEAIHAVNHLFDWSATPTNRDTEEVFAHSVAHIINNVLEKLKPRKQDKGTDMTKNSPKVKKKGVRVTRGAAQSAP